MKPFTIKLLVFCALMLPLQVLFSLDYNWKRDLTTGNLQALRIGIPEPYEPDPEIRAIQEYHREHDKLGFTWKPSITPADNAAISWRDTPAGSIVTDEFGFVNAPSAIEMRNDSMPVEITGIGASFMEGAQDLLHDYFALNGYFYYSFGHQRFSFPQYNIALQEHALPMNPRWVLYGVNEVSYALVEDFENWQESPMGWFAYHNGTWCGPSVERGFPHDQLQRFPRIHKLYIAMTRKMFRGKHLFQKSPSKEELVEKTFSYIRKAHESAKQKGIRFVALLIPQKTRMVHGDSPAFFLIEGLIPRLQQADIPLIDLRDAFSQVEDPSTLYYRHDGHWNRQGIYLAAREVLSFVETESSTDLAQE